MGAVKISILLLFIALVSGCIIGQTEEKIKIGGAFSLTGPAAEWGQDELRAVELAIDEVNKEGGIDGKPVELIIEDTRTDSTGTLNAINKLVTVDGVRVVIGPTWADSYSGIVGSVSNHHKIVHITPSGAIEVSEELVDYPYFFSTWFPQLPEIRKQIQYLEENNYTTAVLIHDQDPFVTKMSLIFEEEAKKKNIETTRFEVPLGTKDFRTVLTRVKVQNPDVVFVAIVEVGEIGSAIKTMKELQMTGKIMGTASIQQQNLLDSYGDYAEDSIIYTYPDRSSENYAIFKGNFLEKYGREPSGASVVNAYDATRMALTALKTGARTGEEIKDALNELSIEGTVVENLSFIGKGGVAEAPLVLKTVRNGEFVEI